MLEYFLSKLDKNIFTFKPFNNIVNNFLFKYNTHNLVLVCNQYKYLTSIFSLLLQ